MWYFTWILGVLMAVFFAIINTLWYEAEQHLDSVADDEKKEQE